MKKIEPVGDLILVQRLDKEVVSEGGIYLPLPNQKSLGVVQSVGRGVLNNITGEFKTFGIEEGDVVLFQTHRGHTVSFDDLGNLLFLSLNHVLCVYKKEDLVNNKMDIRIDVENSTNLFKL